MKQFSKQMQTRMKVRDSLEDLYWSIADQMDEKQADQLDNEFLQFRLKIKRILELD
tara:strand:- start:498 stop:665 length:168 start_codon:yes stop_codon:yes gene_type:complete